MEIDFSALRSEKISDFQCLKTFVSGVEAMDKFIQGDFRISIENHYCTAYGIWYKELLVAVYALSFVDSDDKDELETGISSTGTPNIDLNYKDTFYAKPRYPALDIAYLAVRQEYRGNKVGQSIVETIAEQARSQSFAGCQFLTVEALATKEYSAVGFYERCGFTANEVKKPYKDTLRMFRTLYTNDDVLDE